MTGILKKFARELSDKDIGTHAASSTFFLFLSIFPILILLSLLLPVTGLDARTMVQTVTDITPDFIDGLVEQIIRETYDHAGGLVPFSVLIVLWSATKSMNALIRGLRLVYNTPGRGNFVILNLTAILSTLAGTIFLFLSMLGLVLANALLHAVGADQLRIPVIAEIFLHFRYIIMLALCILFLTLLYTYVSGAERRMRAHLPGAVAASVAMALFTGIFSVYVGYNQNYSTIYGSFATFVVMLLWAYACIYIVLACGCLNRVIRNSKPGMGNTTDAG